MGESVWGFSGTEANPNLLTSPEVILLFPHLPGLAPTFPESDCGLSVGQGLPQRPDGCAQSTTSLPNARWAPVGATVLAGAHIAQLNSSGRDPRTQISDAFVKTNKQTKKTPSMFLHPVPGGKMSHYLSLFHCFIFCLFRAAPVAYGGSHTRDPIRSVATGLHHSHSNAGSELCL